MRWIQDRRNGREPACSGASSLVLTMGRCAERGVTLIEILVVLAIMSMVSAAVGFAVIPKLNQARIEAATNSMREVRNATARWKSTRGGDDCPTPTQLVQDKEIDTASKIDDPWGSAYKIQCLEDEIIVTSPGPDKKEGTKDDLSVPAAAQVKP